MTETTVAAVETRTCLLGGETRTRSLFGGMSIRQLVITAALGTLALVLLVIVRTFWLLAVEAVLAGLLWVLSRRRTDHGEAWTGTLVELVRFRVARRSGGDRYAPPANVSPRPLPKELGAAKFVAVAAVEDGPELGVVEHGVSYLSTVLEVVGGGDGLRETREVNAFGQRFGRFLYALSGPQIPVDQVDLSTRVLPVDGREYAAWIENRMNPRSSPELQESMRDLSGRVAWTGEAYRTFMTICMPTDALVARTARTGPVNPSRIAETAYEVTGLVAREATRAGLTVRAGLGPRRLGGLIRHLYDPSWSLDELTGIENPRDGFRPYIAHRDALEVPTEDGSWWHATATVPRDGWPLQPVGVRWLEGLVTDVTPATIRTITTQHRLISKAAARQRAFAALTLDEADIRSAEKRGQVSTGEREAQAAVPARILHDLLHAGAAGCRPMLRMTVSAPNRPALTSAREVLEAAGQDIGLTRLQWHDSRQHHGHLLSLSLGRGIKR